MDSNKIKAVIVLQCYIRRYLAFKKLKNLRIKKKIEELKQEAYIQSVYAYRREQEEKQKIETEKKKIEFEFKKRKQKVLECAYEGRKQEICNLIDEQCKTDDLNGIGYDYAGEALRLKHKIEIINCEDSNKNSALSEAFGGYLDTVCLFLENSASINSRGQFGRTPLYRAAFGNHFEIVKTLLKHGADPRLYADDGQKPIDVAMDKRIVDLINSWDINQTERLLEHIHLNEEKINKCYERGYNATIENLKLKEKEAEKCYQVMQTELYEAHGQLNKRIQEYDHAVECGYDKLNIMKNIINDAELHLESVKIKMNNASENVQQVKLQCRLKINEDYTKTNDVDNNNKICGIRCSIRELDDVLIKDVANQMFQWPLVIDPTGQALIFLRYRDTNYVNILNRRHLEKDRLRIALLAALRYGKPFVLDLMSVDSLFDKVYRDCLDSIQSSLLDNLINKNILKPHIFETLIRDEDGDDFSPKMFCRKNLERFTFILVTKNLVPNTNLMEQFIPVWVE